MVGRDCGLAWGGLGGVGIIKAVGVSESECREYVASTQKNQDIQGGWLFLVLFRILVGSMFAACDIVLVLSRDGFGEQV